MICCIKTICRVAVLLGLFIIPGYAVAISMPGISTESTALNSLMNQPTQFPSCNDTDKYWYQKSGPDSVIEEPVKPSAAIIEADEISGQESGANYARGNVVGYKDDKTIVADWLIYDQSKAHATGGGNIVLSRQYDVLTGQWVDYYMDLNKGEIKQATAYQAQTNMYAKGEQINIYDKEHYKVQSAYMTTCDPGNPAWHVTAKEMNFDYQNSEGNSKGTIFYAESAPLAYIPYFQFPLGKRKSGFLTPEILGSTTAGTGIGLPYYWNMAPNYDMTIDPRAYSMTGVLIAGQFRYLTESGSGEIYTEQVPNQWSNGQYRYDYHLTDNHTILPNTTIGYTFNQVSDSNYFVDYGNFYSTVDNINLNRSAFIKYAPSWGQTSLLVQNYQTLQPTTITTPVAPIYSILPQANFNVNPQKIGETPLKINLISQYSNFNSESLQSGQRALIYPSLTMPLQNSWGFITPKFGYNYTNYQLQPYNGVSQTGYSGFNRTIPISSIDGGMIFERPTSLGQGSYVQTLEPRLYYLYIPAVYQGNIPTFDTAPATYNINQLFSENRFAGVDRINMANDLTMGVSSKLINDNNGFELANWGVGYRYFITPENNTLYGSYNQFQQLYLPQPNLIAELGNKWSKAWTSNINVQYTTIYQQIDAYALQLRYNPEDSKVVNIRYGYQYQTPLLYYAWQPGQAYVPAQYENQYALDVSAQWPIYANRWFLEGRANYDFTAGSFLNLLGGIQYNGGCWSLHGVAENYITNINQYTTSYFIRLELKGLGNIGSGDPTNDLRLNIPGYVPVTSIH